MKFRLVIAELFRADGRTNMTKLIIAYRNFSNAPKFFKILHGASVGAVLYCNNIT